MAYKSILTVTLGDSIRPEALDAALTLARRNEAYLNVLCLGVDRVQVGYYFDTATPALLDQSVAQAKNEASAARAAVEARLAREGVSYGVRAAVVQVGGLAQVVGHAARFNDLVVLAKPYGRDDQVEAAAVLEAALFEGDAAVLVVPESGIPAEIGRKIVIGWNESTEALAAIRAAMPLLKAADSVDVAIIDPAVHEADRSDPGSELCTMLSRHGVNVEATVLAKTMPKVADVLSRHARDEGADLLVMGAYGHSRFRQSILGGATRDTLASVTLPVLMAH